MNEVRIWTPRMFRLFIEHSSLILHYRCDVIPLILPTMWQKPYWRLAVYSVSRIGPKEVCNVVTELPESSIIPSTKFLPARRPLCQPFPYSCSRSIAVHTINGLFEYWSSRRRRRKRSIGRTARGFLSVARVRLPNAARSIRCFDVLLTNECGNLARRLTPFIVFKGTLSYRLDNHTTFIVRAITLIRQWSINEFP